MSEKGEFFKLASFSKCPNCGGEFEKGYIHAPQGIFWSMELLKWTLTPLPWHPKAETIKSPYSLTGTQVPSFRCKECKIIVFDYGVNP
jgi:hypothetical protein